MIGQALPMRGRLRFSAHRRDWGVASPSELFFLPFGAGCAMVGAAKGVREAWRRMEPRCGRSL